MAKVGRPTDYREEYCEMVIEHMSKGYSFESFAGTIGTHKQVLYSWRDKFPEFNDSVKIAFDKCRIWWEQQGMDGLWSTKSGSFNSSNYIFQMKNRFRGEWNDKSEVDHTTNGEKINLISLGSGVKPSDDE